MNLATVSKLRVRPFWCSEVIVCIDNAVVKQLAGEGNEKVAASEEDEEGGEEHA